MLVKLVLVCTSVFVIIVLPFVWYCWYNKNLEILKSLCGSNVPWRTPDMGHSQIVRRQYVYIYIHSVCCTFLLLKVMHCHVQCLCTWWQPTCLISKAIIQQPQLCFQILCHIILINVHVCVNKTPIKERYHQEALIQRPLVSLLYETDTHIKQNTIPTQVEVSIL